MIGKDQFDLKEAVRTLLPFLEATRDKSIEGRIESAPAEFLRRFYLFAASGLVISKGETDISRFIEQRFQNVLAAAHRAGWTVLTAAVGSSAGVELYFGFMTENNRASSDPYVFERIMRGLLPGLELRFIETVTIESFLNKKTYGGIVAGVPTLKIDDERQRFNLPVILRSLHGEDYVLLIVSKPVEMAEVANQLHKIWQVSDYCHRMGRYTLTSENGGAISTHQEQSESTATTESKYKKALMGATVGGGIGGMLGGAAATAATGPLKLFLLEGLLSGLLGSVVLPAALPAALIGAGVGASILLSASGQKTQTVTSGSGYGEEKHWSTSLTLEEQNSVALELERLAQRQANRLMKAANVGEWETFITFATCTPSGRDILAGSLLGELAKPSTDIFPPRIAYAELSPSCPLILPRLDQMSDAFPRSLASYLTSEELASLASPPAEPLPGYDIRHTPVLSLTDVRTTKRCNTQRLGCVCDHGRVLEGVNIEIAPEELAKHLFVCGLTGSGKTTTVKELLAGLTVPFLVIESAKRDYRQFLGSDLFRDKLRVYTIGDGTIAPILMNPFFVMPGVSPQVHIDFLKAIFNASFSLYGPMPYILEKCIHNVYIKRGWDLTSGIHPYLYNPDGTPDKPRYREKEAEFCFPTLFDLKEEVQNYIRTSLQYRGELSDNIRTAILTRLESLCVGAKGLMFGTSKPLDIVELLQYPTVLELEALSDDDDKAFFVGLMLTFISEYRQCNNPALNPYMQKGNDLQHVLVIEEAHRLLKNVVQERLNEQIGNPRGKAVEFFANIISEMRSMGQGVVVVEQIPTKILPDVIKNTNAKIVHRLVANDDQVLMASSLGLTAEESLYLTSLTTGHVLYLKEGMQRPIEVKVFANVPSVRISHDRVRRSMQALNTIHDIGIASAIEVRNLLGSKGDAIILRTLCSFIICEDSQINLCVENCSSAIHSLLLAHGRSFSSATEERYLADRLTAILVLGVFRLNNDAISGIADIVRSLLAGQPNAIKEFRRQLAMGWKVEDARQGAIQRVCELAYERAIQHKLNKSNLKEIDSIVSTYLLIDNPIIRNDIVVQIATHLGG